MPKVGVIADLTYERHHLFSSYYSAISNIYNQVPVKVLSADDLKGVEILFIGDDHYGGHKSIWTNPYFQFYCNVNNIKVVVLTNEKILGSFFPWNESNLGLLEGFHNLYHYANDVDDCRTLGLKLNRTAPSCNVKNYLDQQYDIRNLKKINGILFIGQTRCPKNSYKERNELLENLKKHIPVKIIDSTIQSWDEYILLLASYRFILSPIGNGNFFPMRFYEALMVGSIPLHQVRLNTLDTYDIEKGFKDCIYFETIEDLLPKVENCENFNSYNELYMEDTLRILLNQDKLL